MINWQVLNTVLKSYHFCEHLKPTKSARQQPNSTQPRIKLENMGRCYLCRISRLDLPELLPNRGHIWTCCRSISTTYHLDLQLAISNVIFFQFQQTLYLGIAILKKLPYPVFSMLERRCINAVKPSYSLSSGVSISRRERLLIKQNASHAQL
jgi:hypothetical protein